MKVFISWSGGLSEQLAGALRDWLPNVIQRVHPYFTPRDLDKGVRWLNEISAELQSSKLGIICVTPDNMESSWIMFEAGAISATFQQNKICPILFGLTKKELRGPLFQFQAVDFLREEIKGLVQSINSELGEDRLSENGLEKIFDKWWPDLKHNVEEILKAEQPPRPKEKTEIERHTELMGAIHQILEMRKEEFRHQISEDIFVNIYANIDAALASHGQEEDLLEALSMLARNVEFLHQRITPRPAHIDRGSRVLDRISGERRKIVTSSKTTMDGDTPF